MTTSPNPNFTHPTLHLLSKCNTLRTLKQVHAQMITTCLALHTYPLSKLLIASSALSGHLGYALSIFDQITNPTTFLFNTLISSLVTADRRRDDNDSEAHRARLVAFSLYNRLLSHRHRPGSLAAVEPNSFTYPSLFKACCGSREWARRGGLALHAHVVKFLGLACDRFVSAALLSCYASCGKLRVARYLFDRVSDPDLATWNSILSAYTREIGGGGGDDDTSLSLETLYLFNEMLLSSNVRPNEVTIVALISACAHLGALSQGTWAHVYVLKNDLQLNRFVITSLIDLYSKCGCLHLACQLFDEIPQRDTACYNAMIRGLAIYGHGHKAIDLYEKMKVEGLVPDNVTFVVAMCACSHSGLVEEGCEIFESVKGVYGIEPTLEHYGCFVDLLARAGRVREAVEKVREMPMKPNAILWRSLLGAARVHGELKIGEIALKHLLELEPESSGSYVLLSNMYARNNKWEDVKRIRKVMKGHGIIKMPGRSLVEIFGAIHEFIMGDKTHPLSKEIYLKLEEINGRLQEFGYTPRTKEVLFDIEEEEKEDVLSYHSEKLAIAFALIVVDDPRIPIRITKNLRVCGDCHESSKLISRVYSREIIVRDRNRFHHFNEGTCSCSDFW